MTAHYSEAEFWLCRQTRIAGQSDGELLWINRIACFSVPE